MALNGRKPNPDRTLVRNRNAVSEWTEYLNVPFRGAPPLPARQPVMDGDVQVAQEWPAATLRWWKAVSQMPHAVAWTQTDWEYAFLTAEVHARFTLAWKGATGAELRMREKYMGTFAEARRDLRIRYVDPPPAGGSSTSAQSENVSRLADYRNL
ncbi:MAG: hypothetical protein REI11_19120 [Patulibacter sp.]|nr:hypothetical protein [Patulibacter sp.]